MFLPDEGVWTEEDGGSHLSACIEVVEVDSRLADDWMNKMGLPLQGSRDHLERRQTIDRLLSGPLIDPLESPGGIHMVFRKDMERKMCSKV